MMADSEEHFDEDVVDDEPGENPTDTAVGEGLEDADWELVEGLEGVEKGLTEGSLDEAHTADIKALDEVDGKVLKFVRKRLSRFIRPKQKQHVESDKDDGGFEEHISKQTAGALTVEMRQSKLEDSYQYNMDSKQGCAVLISNEFGPQGNQGHRAGAGKDLADLKKVFLDRLGFTQLNVGRDFEVSQKGLTTILDDAVEKMRNRKYDCFVFAISSHGGEDINRKRGGEMDPYVSLVPELNERLTGQEFLSNIINKFHDSLPDKPKLFFFQCCRSRHLAPEKQTVRFCTQKSYRMVECDLGNEESRTSFVFSVMVASDVHVLLHQREGDRTNNIYEIVLGCHGNTQSFIRKERRAQIPSISVPTTDILSLSEWRTFWISWNFNKVQVGRGSIIGREVIMEYSDPNFTPVNYVSVGTGCGVKGQWKYDVESTSEVKTLWWRFLNLGCIQFGLLRDNLMEPCLDQIKLCYIVLKKIYGNQSVQYRDWLAALLYIAQAKEVDYSQEMLQRWFLEFCTSYYGVIRDQLPQTLLDDRVLGPLCVKLREKLGKQPVFYEHFLKAVKEFHAHQDADRLDAGAEVELERTNTGHNRKNDVSGGSGDTSDAGFKSDPLTTPMAPMPTKPQEDVTHVVDIDLPDAGHRRDTSTPATPPPAPPQQLVFDGNMAYCSHDDCLVMAAVPSRKFGWRSSLYGSWMIDELQKAMPTASEKKPVYLLQVLTSVAQAMAARQTEVYKTQRNKSGVLEYVYDKDGNRIPEPTHGMKAVPLIEHTLTKEIVFKGKFNSS